MTKEQEIKQCGKIRGAYVNPEAVYEALKQDIRISTRNLTPINVVSQPSTTDLDELDPSFMYSQLLKEILIDIPHDDNEKKILAEFCCKKYADNTAQMKIIAEFEREYDKPSPIWVVYS